jgi:zinc protease
VRAGSHFEDEARSGITNFLQRTLLRGTRTRTAVQLVQQAEDIGGTLEASGDVEHAEIRGEALAAHWERLLALIADVALQPALAPEEVELERRLILGQIDTRTDAPFALAMDTLMQELFGRHPYARTPLGLRPVVEGLSREDLLAHRAAMYRADRMVPSARVFQLARRLFAKLPRSVDPIEPPSVALPSPGTRRVIEKPSQQTQVVVGFVGPGMFDADYAATRVLAALMGGGMSGRLFSELREQQGLAYSVGTTSPLRTGRGVLASYIGTAPATAAVAEERLLAEMNRARVEGVGPEELSRAKAYLLGNLAMDRRTNARYAWYMAFFELVGAGWQYPDRFARDIERVSATDVIAAARRYLVRPTIVVLGPAR